VIFRPDEYIAFASSKLMRITHLIDTHVHADHRSGGPPLAMMTGAQYCLQRAAEVAFPFRPLHGCQDPLLSRSRQEFVEAVADVRPTPAAMEQILRFNRGREGACR
jgi:glyoxylase-like metal-dependent hydrolase (beta-lactamase superfamily II)